MTLRQKNMFDLLTAAAALADSPLRDAKIKDTARAIAGSLEAGDGLYFDAVRLLEKVRNVVGDQDLAEECRQAAKLIEKDLWPWP